MDTILKSTKRSTPTTAISSPLSGVVPSLPHKNQQMSPLLRLPIELLQIVLREVLVSCGPISTRAEYLEPFVPYPKRDARGRFVGRRKKQLVTGYYLTPAILRTCQTMLLEGLPILYGQNTLHLCVTAMQPRGPCCNFRSTRGISVLDNDHLKCLSERGRQQHPDDSRNFVGRFENYRFFIATNLNGEALLNGCCQLLGSTAYLFSAKNVEVDIGHEIEQVLSDKGLLFDLLVSFLCLRCASFRFIGLTNPIADAIATNITSHTLPIDLMEYNSNLLEMVARMVAREEHIDLKRYLCNAQRELWKGTLSTYRIAMFMAARIYILRTWKEAATPTKMARAEDDGEGGNGMSQRWSGYHLVDSEELELEIEEDGPDVNAALRSLAVIHNLAERAGVSESLRYWRAVSFGKLYMEEG